MRCTGPMPHTSDHPALIGTASPKALLAWCCEQIREVSVLRPKDFGHFWESGAGFLAVLGLHVESGKTDKQVLYAHKPNNCWFANSKLPEHRIRLCIALQKCSAAFEAGAKFGVPRLLDPKSTGRFGERLVTLYLAETWHALQSSRFSHMRGKPTFAFQSKSRRNLMQSKNSPRI